LVAEVDRDPRRMKLVLEEVECLPQVALPAGDIAHHEEVEPRSTCRLQHCPHGGRGVHGAARLGRGPLEAGVDQAEARDGMVLEVTLRPGAVSVELSRGGLAYPARRAHSL